MKVVTVSVVTAADDGDLEAVIRRTLGENQTDPDPADVLRLYLELPATIEEAELVREHLGTIDGTSGFVVRQRLRRHHVRSSFEASFTDAHNASNGGTSWIGAIGYLVFLDQLGGAVRPLSGPQPSRSDLERALEMFTDCTEAERAALYALRCCLAHDFSLANLAERTPEHRRHLYRHFFHLVPSRQLDRLVEFPPTAWDGDFGDLRPTFVDLGHLEDTAARARDQAIAAHAAGELELRIPAIEARHRFLFGHPAEIAPSE